MTVRPRTALDPSEIDALLQERLATTSASGVPLPPKSAAYPPGPRFPAVAQSLLLLGFRHHFVPWLHRKYGDVITLRLLPEGRRVVLFAHPDHIREIFAGDPEVFQAGRGNLILGPLLGHRSVLLQDSSQHRRSRKLLMPAFHGPALRGYRTLVSELASAEVVRWRPGTPFAMHQRMTALTLEIILQVVFGVTDPERLAGLRPRVTRALDVSPWRMIGWFVPGLRRLRPWRAMNDNQRELDLLIHEEIAQRRRAPDLADRTDVLSRLLQVPADAPQAGGDEPMDDAELRDQLVTLLMAGHETTASAVSWALYELGRDPHLRERCERAADTAAPAGGDDLLEAVVKEALRLHTVIAMVNRTLTRPARVGGRDLPAGTTVAASILLVHESERWHEAAGTFRPDRYLQDSPAPNTWVPFGGGTRRCLGAGFAMMEGVEILRAVLRSCHVEAVGTDAPRVRNVTSVPRRGAVMRVRPRQGASAGPPGQGVDGR